MTFDRDGMSSPNSSGLSPRLLIRIQVGRDAYGMFLRTPDSLAQLLPKHYYPTIYSLHDPNPVAVCSARKLPGGDPVPENDRTYSNSCTIKVRDLLPRTS